MSHRVRKCTFGAIVLGVLGGISSVSHAYTFSDITNWTGTGNNSAAIVVDWSSPQLLDETGVNAPTSEVTQVWGYHFNGTQTASQMLEAIAAANQGLYVAATFQYGTFVEGLGYSPNHTMALTDGTTTIGTSSFVNGVLNADTNLYYDADAFNSVNSSDVYWGGYYGPNWEAWTGIDTSTAEPDRGSDQYWTPDLVDDPYYGTGTQGQWALNENGLDATSITDGSWIGFSVARGAFDYSDPSDPDTIAYDDDKQAPQEVAVPEPGSLTLLCLGTSTLLLGRKRARKS